MSDSSSAGAVGGILSPLCEAPGVLSAELIALLRRLCAAPDVAALLARATAEAPAATGLDRAVVAAVSEGLLILPPDATGASAEPVAVPLGDAEARALGLRRWSAAPVAAGDTTLALVVADRDGPPITAAEQRAVEDVAAVVAIALERAVLRRRAGELSEEVRRFADLARVLTGDLVAAATALPSDHGLGAALPRASTIADDDPAYQGLTGREKRIAGLLVEGRTTREIAEALLVSPETVKTLISRILRKLGAANRVEAIALLLGRAPE